ncbi:OTU-domain-containing protein [Cantharellus anzutake]|uniref:OTU-domain-containing protein n=1 Tax=Cantharellus anzutake TaxID=1750568 RepID=UPI001908E0C0|nr:OTU-domain-containing protein [Cantharellus anzutake]KAF8343899.1 OTU-domain-containing protein [Cantharellus anzutake]
MANTFPVRLRSPKGTTTIHVNPNRTIGDLQLLISSATQILPSLQDIKIGYPPTQAMLVPSLPLASLNLKRGDQIIVSTLSAEHSVLSSATKHITASPRDVDGGLPTLGAGGEGASSMERERLAVQDHSGDGLVDHVAVDGQFLVLREVPDDNSCLFSSIALIFEQDMRAAPKLRSVVASAIKGDPDTFSDVFLGRPRDEYITTILKATSWGGAIELSILSDHYQTEISSFDVETGRCDRFGQGKYQNRCFLMYSGIHYDAVSMSPTVSAPADFHQTVFPVEAEGIFAAAGRLAVKRREKGAFTNTTTFDLCCQTCGVRIKGEKDARAHAKETGHAEFGEY